MQQQIVQLTLNLRLEGRDAIPAGDALKDCLAGMADNQLSGQVVIDQKKNEDGVCPNAMISFIDSQLYEPDTDEDGEPVILSLGDLKEACVERDRELLNLTRHIVELGREMDALRTEKQMARRAMIDLRSCAQRVKQLLSTEPLKTPVAVDTLRVQVLSVVNGTLDRLEASEVVMDQMAQSRVKEKETNGKK